MKTKAALIVTLIALALTACAPTMGGSTTNELAGTMTATYQADPAPTFAAAHLQMLQTPGWSLTANDEANGYLRAEQTSMRYGLLAGPRNVTEYVTVTITRSGNETSVVIQYTEGGTTLAQGLASSLNAELNHPR